MYVGIIKVPASSRNITPTTTPRSQKYLDLDEEMPPCRRRHVVGYFIYRYNYVHLNHIYNCLLLLPIIGKFAWHTKLHQHSHLSCSKHLNFSPSCTSLSSICICKRYIHAGIVSIVSSKFKFKYSPRMRELKFNKIVVYSSSVIVPLRNKNNVKSGIVFAVRVSSRLWRSRG